MTIETLAHQDSAELLAADDSYNRWLDEQEMTPEEIDQMAADMGQN